MASYHLSVHVGAKGKAAAHSEYISREGKYADRSSASGASVEDLDVVVNGNLPAWAADRPSVFWQAVDQYERANGLAYKEFEIALPRELTAEQRRELVDDFVKQTLGNKFVFQYAIHCPKAAIEGGEQPHAHVMYSPRQLDGIERTPDKFFSRYNSNAPERGGCQKATGGKDHKDRKKELLEHRERWANIQNAHLARHKHAARVDHRSHADRGLSTEPERHLGPERARSSRHRAEVLFARADRQELAAAQRDVAELDAGKKLSDLRVTAIQESARQAEAALRAKLAADKAKQEKEKPAVPAPEPVAQVELSPEQRRAAWQAERETVAGYMRQRQQSTGKEYRVAHEGQRIVGKVVAIKELDGVRHVAVDVGRDRVLLAPADGLKGAYIDRKIDGTVRGGKLDYQPPTPERGGFDRSR